MLDHALLMKELRQWSADTIEKPQKKFNNLPACPFAKNSWDKKRVNVIQSKCNSWFDLMDTILNFDDNYDVVIYCGTDYDIIDVNEFEDRVHLLNEVSNSLDIYIMGSHPDTVIDFASEANEDFEELLDEDYYVLYVQRLEYLIKASDNILKKGYYKNYSAKDLSDQITDRRKLWQAKRKKQ